MQKLASAPAFHLKGTGWYVTDYAKKSADAGKGKPDEGKPGDSKPVEGKPSESKSGEGKSDTKGAKDTTAAAATTVKKTG